MIAVIGLGFIGLTTALGYCEKGFKVCGVDICKDRFISLKNKIVPFKEPLLEEKLSEHIDKKFFLKSLEDAVAESEIIFLCVGTDQETDGSVSLACVEDAITNCLRVKKNNFKVFIIRSTVPPVICAEKIKNILKNESLSIGIDVGVAFNPEFLREGYAWHDFTNPDRIIFGVEDDKTKKHLPQLLSNFNAPVHYVSYATASFVKYLSNSMLATMISFANEMSAVAMEFCDVDIRKSFEILHQDRRFRVGDTKADISSYIYPGCGFGGYCLPKDLHGIIASTKMIGNYEPVLLQSVLTINDTIKDILLKKIYKNIPPGKKIGILGLSFKPNSDDVRDSSSFYFISSLLNKGYVVNAHDPIAIDAFQATYPDLDIKYCHNLKDIESNSHCMILLTAWHQYDYFKDSNKVFDFRYCI